MIVARHPEQDLVERNQTLARQLAYRGLAFTLLRRFAYMDWVGALSDFDRRDGGESSLVIRLPENITPDIPSDYPERPDHLRARLKADGKILLEEELPLMLLGNAELTDEDTRAELTDEDALSLDLPQRLGAFQQGALVLQWGALPFYYHHRLLVIAQTASTVSPINEIIQRDFRIPLTAALGELPWQRAHRLVSPRSV